MWLCFPRCSFHVVHSSLLIPSLFLFPLFVHSPSPTLFIFSLCSFPHCVHSPTLFTPHFIHSSTLFITHSFQCSFTHSVHSLTVFIPPLCWFPRFVYSTLSIPPLCSFHHCVHSSTLLIPPLCSVFISPLCLFLHSVHSSILLSVHSTSLFIPPLCHSPLCSFHCAHTEFASALTALELRANPENLKKNRMTIQIRQKRKNCGILAVEPFRKPLSRCLYHCDKCQILIEGLLVYATEYCSLLALLNDWSFALSKPLVRCGCEAPVSLF